VVAVALIIQITLLLVVALVVLGNLNRLSLEHTQQVLWQQQQVLQLQRQHFLLQ
jgi:hypothetical protein